MNGKKIVLLLSMAGMLAIAWILTIQDMTGTEKEKKQKELIVQADMYAEKELYMRAIPLYEEALNYSTSLNYSIEEKLLECYEGYGDWKSYIALVNLRVDKNRATEQEYIIVADYYLNNYKLEEAMNMIKKGMVALKSEQLNTYYEEHRYTYSMKITRYEDIMPTKDNLLMPAYDGEQWVYINDSGQLELDSTYDTVTPFNQAGYAAVSKEGKYYTIISNGAKYSVDENGVTDVYSLTNKYILAQVDGTYGYYDYEYNCVSQSHQYDAITTNACGRAAVKKGSNWGIITDSGEVVVDFILEDVAINSLGSVYANNVAMVKKEGAWYLIDTNGNQISEQGFYNAKAPESSGYIAVADDTGLWGYINQQGEEVISYQYHDAKSFSNHLGAVCIIDTWGYISEKNILVIEEILEDAQPFHNGIAQAKFMDGEALIKLNYFEE